MCVCVCVYSRGLPCQSGTRQFCLHQHIGFPPSSAAPSAAAPAFYAFAAAHTAAHAAVHAAVHAVYVPAAPIVPSLAPVHRLMPRPCIEVQFPPAPRVAADVAADAGADADADADAAAASAEARA